MINTDMIKVEPWLENETSEQETTNISLCANKGCGFNNNKVCSSTGTICYGYMEGTDETTY